MKKKDDDLQEINETQVCEKCGSVLTEEDGEMICPHCDAEIDFLGGEDDE